MSDYDPENSPSASDPASEPAESPPERPTPIRRVGRRDRKQRIKREDDSSFFDALDDSEMIEPATNLPDALGRPLPDDAGIDTLQGDFIVDHEDRFPPVVVTRPAERGTRRARSRSDARSRNDTGHPEIDRSQPMARKRRVSRQDRIALLFLLATLVMGTYFVYIWQNPYSVLNPLAPERPVIYVTATPGSGTPGSSAETDAAPPFTYVVSENIQRGAAPDQCDRVLLTGLIQRTGEEQGFAMRAADGEVDEGVLTSYLAEARAQAYLITLPMPQTETNYALQMYDLAGQALSAPVSLQITPGCDGNRISVNFMPQGS